MQITMTKVHELAREHARMYENRILSRSPMVNVEECQQYLGIWNAVLHTQHPDDLPDRAVREIKDAYYSGDFEHIFGECNNTPLDIIP